MLQRLLAIGSVLLFQAALARATMAAPPADAQPPFTLDTGRLAVRIQPEKAYTLDRVLLGKVELGRPNGNYGLAYNEGNNQWIGGGHTEGGREEVQKVTLIVDGKMLTPPYDANLKGERFEFIKESNIGKLKVVSRLTLTGDEITEQQDVEAREPVTIDNGYAFMHCWTPETTHWLATSLRGAQSEGTFDNEGWEVQDDVRWLALYEPKSESVILTEFPPDLPRGQGHKHAVWDLKAYHKQYYQPWRRTGLKPGEIHTYRMTVKAFHAPVDQWKQKAAATAREYEGGYHITEQPAPATTEESKSAAQLALEASRPRIDPAHPPEWLRNPVAMEALEPDTVLAPWTPVEADEQRVAVWGRSHDLGAWGLPRQITAAGEPLLAAPIMLDVEFVDSGVPEPGATQLLERRAGRARYRATAKRGAVEVTLDSTYEFDGMMRFDLAFHGGDAAVKRLALKVPLREEQAMFFQHASAWKLGMSQQNTAVSQAVPQGSGEVYRYGFSPSLWLGGYDRGLAWFSESDEHWTPAKGNRAIRLVRERDQMHLLIDIVAQPTTLRDGAKLTFGLMATPVKSLPEGWRSWRITTEGPASRPAEGHDQRGNQVIYWYDRYRVVRHDPTPRDMAAFAKAVQDLNDEGVNRVYPYINVTLMSRGEKVHIPGEDFHFVPPEWEAYGELWMIQPNYTSYPYLRVSPASTWADFSLYQINRYIVEGHASGIYLDESFPYADTAEGHGMGYTDATGTRQPTYAIFATRDWYKRLAYLFEKHAKGRPAILVHTSATIAVPYLSMADIQLTGEQYYHSMRHWEREDYPSYIEMAPPEDFHAEHRGVQFGLVPAFLPLYKTIHKNKWPETITQPGPTRELLAMTLLHDVLVWPNFCHTPSVLEAQRVKAAFGIGGKEVVYHPYWREKQAVYQADRPEVMVSYYSKPGGALIVVGNLGNHPSRVRLNPSVLSGVTSPGELTVTDGESTQPVLMEGGQPVIDVPAKDYRLIRLYLDDAPGDGDAGLSGAPIGTR